MAVPQVPMAGSPADYFRLANLLLQSLIDEDYANAQLYSHAISSNPPEGRVRYKLRFPEVVKYTDGVIKKSTRYAKQMIKNDYNIQERSGRRVNDTTRSLRAKIFSVQNFASSIVSSMPRGQRPQWKSLALELRTLFEQRYTLENGSVGWTRPEPVGNRMAHDAIYPEVRVLQTQVERDVVEGNDSGVVNAEWLETVQALIDLTKSLQHVDNIKKEHQRKGTSGRNTFEDWLDDQQFYFFVELVEEWTAYLVV